MNVVIAGCGYLGEATAGRLRARGHHVVGITRSTAAAETLGHRGIEAIACDLADQAAVARLPDADAVVHCASSGRGGPASYRDVYLLGCRHLLDRYPGTPLIFTSSTSVYRQIDGSWVDEESAADPTTETGTILRAAENLVLAAGGTVLRLAGLYGPRRSVLLSGFLAGTAQIDVRHDPPSTPDGRWINQIHRDDAAEAVNHALATPLSGLFNAADGTPMTQRDLYSELSRRFDRPMPPERLPDLNRKRGWTNKRVSSRRLCDSGWSPLYPSWVHALEHDPELVASLQHRPTTKPAPGPAQ